jgi:hypothetical protein
MWRDALAGFRDAPLWAQVAMAAFAAGVVMHFVRAWREPRRHRRRFAALAHAAGATLEPLGAGFHSFPATEAGRTFEVRHDYWRRNPGGPIGHVLLVTTDLTGTAWDAHWVEITRRPDRGNLRESVVESGDAAFDARFDVRQDGVPVRDRWLDAPTRSAIARFHDETPGAARLLVDQGTLKHVAFSPWEGIDPSSLRTLLSGLAAVASALEETARI